MSCGGGCGGSRSRATPHTKRNLHYCVVDPEAEDGVTCFYNAYEARTYAKKKKLAPPMPRYIDVP